MNQGGGGLYSSGSGLRDGELSRTSSMPTGMNTIEGSVQLRLHPTRSNKKAQYWRNSVAVTNSDYHSQWRTQLSPLVKVHGSGAIAATPSAPSLDTISEYEMRGLASEQFRSPLHYSRKSEERGASVADPNMFQYTPTPALDPSSRQRVSTPLSRPTTPQIGSAGFARPSSLIVTTSPPAVSNPSILKNSSQAVHISASANNQFLPLFLNPETGNVYMFEDGYYLPVPAKNVEEVERATNLNGLTKPPTPDRRAAPLPSPAPDYLKLVLAMLVVSILCLNLPVFLLLSLPALACSLQARRDNSAGQLNRARACAEWALCSCVSAVIFILLTILAIPATLLILHFVLQLF